MMNEVKFEIPKYSIEQIKKDYYLYDLCENDTAQLENVAITIQSLYFYQNILTASSYPKTLESSLCRTIIIMSYSIIEAIVISVGYKLQKCCLHCSKGCIHCSDSMFMDERTHSNEMRAFPRANDFLKKTKIINLTSRASAYYENFRDNRNNVHLARNSKVISNDNAYTREACNSAIDFLQTFIEHIQSNFLEFRHKYHCGR